jgi:hypothetical protein
VDRLAGREADFLPRQVRRLVARLTRCISMRLSSAFQTARWSKASRSKSPPSSLLIRASTFLLNAAVTPWASS